MIIKTMKEEYKLYKYMSLILPAHLDKEFSDELQPPGGILEENKANVKRKVSIEEAREQLVNVRNLTFGVTHNCNLRCKYCAFSGSYKYNRCHNNNSMSMETYKKAVDVFFDLADSPARTFRVEPLIAFYGGEPLLEYDNIMRTCDYVDDKVQRSSLHNSVQYLVTTNGVLLTPERSANLLDRGFRIDISLDGPKDQHDAFRVKFGGTGTFDEIMNNISAIKPEYLPKIRFQLTLHPDHDLKRLEEFFLSNPQLFNQNNILASEVSLMNLKDGNKEELLQRSQKQHQVIYSQLDKSQWFFKKLAFSLVEKYTINPTISLAASASFTGTCFPGVDKIFVENDGSLHVCEKIHPGFPIGHVETGIDYDAVVKMRNQWNEEVGRVKCWDCPVWWTCPYCYALKAKADKIVIRQEACQRYRNAIKKDFENYLLSQEADDQKNHANAYASVRDYLDAL